MAKIGLKGLTYARYSSGGTGSSITYTGGTAAANLMIKADVTVNHADIKQYADDTMVERDNSVSSCSITLELADLSDTEKKAFLGYDQVGTDGLLHVTNNSAPYVGFGYITKRVKAGTVSYVGYWFHKVQFGLDNDGASTKGESTEFQSDSLTGEAMGVQLSSGGDIEYYMTKTATSESTISTWLNTCAGISTQL